LLHLRDCKGRKDCEIGRGSIDFAEVLRAAEKAGAQYGMIEQKTKTPVESVSISLHNL